MKTKKKVAIRVMPTGAICAVSLKHLQREAAIHPTLDHPSIIKCYFCAEEEQAIVMVQEYVPDGSLLDYYAKRRVLLEFEVRSLTQQLVSAIAYLHGKGIVHRDIKADNILIFADTQVIKLADFGFADTIKPDSPYFTNFPGTLAYSPPEVLMGRPHLGPPRDMWSLGVLVYILLTGRYPFGSQATQKTKMRVLNDEPDYVTTKLSAQVRGLLRHSMWRLTALRPLFTFLHLCRISTQPFLGQRPAPEAVEQGPRSAHDAAGDADPPLDDRSFDHEQLDHPPRIFGHFRPAHGAQGRAAARPG